MAKKQDDTDDTTAATNSQDFPARTTEDDTAQEDNVKRLQSAKKDDFERQTLESQREDSKTVDATLSTGAKVTGPKSVIDGLDTQ